jgi:hypothetical protein
MVQSVLQLAIETRPRRRRKPPGTWFNAIRQSQFPDLLLSAAFAAINKRVLRWTLKRWGKIYEGNYGHQNARLSPARRTEEDCRHA